MKLKKKMKRMLEANLMKCNTCNRAAGIKEADDSFLRDFVTAIL